MLPTSRLTNNGAITYSKLVEMAKRVGVVQTAKSQAKCKKSRPEKATAHVSNSAVRVLGKSQDGSALLHANIDTIICSLVSKRTGIVVIVAHTWDGSGRHGIGCDVIRLKSKSCATFKKSIQAAINALNIRNAETAAMASGPAPPPYSVEDPYSGRSCRSVDADNDSFDDGYMAVPSFDSSENEYAEIGEPVYDNAEANQTYMDICGPAIQGQYVQVGAPNVYMDVAPVENANAEDLYGYPIAF